MFKGNRNGDDIKHNIFDVPIIAQWVRINPTRWQDRISLRVEVYGCDYSECLLTYFYVAIICKSIIIICTVAENLYFNGTSLIKLDLLRDPIAASRETIQFRFKTSSANGILLYSRGTQGDYVALQLRENRMILNINLGKLIDFVPAFINCRFIYSVLNFRLWTYDIVISRKFAG